MTPQSSRSATRLKIKLGVRKGQAGWLGYPHWRCLDTAKQTGQHRCRGAPRQWGNLSVFRTAKAHQPIRAVASYAPKALGLGDSSLNLAPLLNKDAPIRRAIQHGAPVLGGLHHHYCRI